MKVNEKSKYSVILNLFQKENGMTGKINQKIVTAKKGKDFESSCRGKSANNRSR